MSSPAHGRQRPLTAVAMSGGLDSSVTAWLLAEKGEACIGLSMLLWDHSGEATHGRCCGALDLGDAQRVARQAGIPHYTLRMDEEFRSHVVDPFVNDYLAGRTPSPCVNCNTWLKFDLLLERARALGADSVATGHYARILEGPDGLELHTALDPDKDQSYYLFELTANQLAAARFPLGEMTKGQVRTLAREVGLVVAEKAESMEVCFVSGSIQEFVEGQVADHPDRFGSLPTTAPAEAVRTDGQALGPSSSPYFRYTVGQRRGVGIGGGEKLYVIGVQPEANQVTLGSQDELLAPGLLGERLHWIGQPPTADPEHGGVRLTVKIRSHHPGVAATVDKAGEESGEGLVAVRFDEPQRGIAPGQAAVFYRGTRVLGGCWIRSAL